MKRLLDIIASLMVLIIFSPIYLLAAVATFLDSGTPIFFVQRRVGKDGKGFNMYKFRSMTVDNARFSGNAPTEDMSLEEIKKLRGKFITSSKGDPRVTKVGGVLRRTYVDELPQMINVFKGEMSLVGPRPDAPVQEVDYTPKQWEGRHKVKPGITGLAQINNFRDGFNLQKRVALDLKYVKNASLKLDIYIIWKTIEHAIKKGSY